MTDKKKQHFSIRWKIFIVMLAVSITPITVFTIYALTSSYSRSYQQTIFNNRNSMSWEEDRLTLYSKELKDTFYSMEFDKSFKKAITGNWTEENGAAKRMTVGNVLTTQLNNNSYFAGIELYTVNGPSDLTVLRSGISQSEASDILKQFARPEGMQTNMFLKRKDEKLYAVHYLNTFPERKLVAKIAVKLKDSSLLDIMDRIHIYDTESIYCFNDQYEVLMTIGQEADPKVLQTILTRLQEKTFTKDYLEVGSNIVIAGNSERDIFHVVKIIPKKEIMRVVLPTAYVGVLIGFLCVIAAVFLSALLSYYVSKPIIRLTNKVKNISMDTLEMKREEYSSEEIEILEEHIAIFVNQIKDLIHQEYETKLEAKSAQIKALQAQINPHFLHNTLQLMGSVSLSKDAAKVYRIASALSDMMRYSMEFETNFVTIAEELGHLENYLFIQKERYFDRFTITYEVEEAAKGCLIPKLLLQPIVENSFQHGFSRASSDWRLWIRVFLSEDGKVHILVKDNGSGITPEELERWNEELKQGTTALRSNRHIGLRNVNNRIKLHFSEEDGIRIESAPDQGTEIWLVFDVKRQEGGLENGI